MNQPKKILVALAVLAGAFFFTCDPTEVSPTSNNGVTASIDGTVFQSSNVTANLFINANDSTLEIKSVNTDGSVIDLSVKHPKVGSFAYTSTGQSDVSMIYKKATNGITVSEVTVNGNISISSFNSSTNKVSGTFSFETDGSEINNGKINNVTFN